MHQAVLGVRSIILMEAQQHHAQPWPSKGKRHHGEGLKELEGPSAVQQGAWLSITLCSLGLLRGFCSASHSELPLAKDEADSAATGVPAASLCTKKHQFLEAGQHMAVFALQLKHFPDSLWQRKDVNLAPSSLKTLGAPIGMVSFPKVFWCLSQAGDFSEPVAQGEQG